MMNPSYICILDFEATCDDAIIYYDNEVIEFPSVLLKLSDDGTVYDVVSEFQRYCKPLLSSTLSKFCTNLTGITQEKVDNGGNFPTVLKEHHKWLSEITGLNSVLFVTVGSWDLKTMMVNECKKWNLIPPTIYFSYVNITGPFRDFYKCGSRGMKGMLEFLDIALTGKHHSGIDDCRNTAKIWQRMISDGCVLRESFIERVEAKEYKIAHPNSNKEKKKEVKRKMRLQLELASDNKS